MKNLLLLAISLTFILFTPGGYAENFSPEKTGLELSELTCRKLAESNISFEKINQVPDYIGEFPSNYLATIPADPEAEISDENRSKIKNAVFAFTQDYFCSNPRTCIDFIKQAEEKKLPYSVEVFIGTDPEKSILNAPTRTPTGTEYFASSIYEIDSYCAFVISDEAYSPTVVHSEGGKNISPQWIVETIVKSCISNDKYMQTRGSFQYLYKSGDFFENKRVASFLKNEIPAAGFSLGHEEIDLNILCSILDNLTGSRSDTWSRHYNFLPIGKGLWINESLIILVFLIFAVIVIFSISFSSFTNTSSNTARLKDLSRTWFLIPLYVILAGILLTLFQQIFAFAKNNAVLYFALKLFTTMLLLFIVSSLQIFIKFRISLSANSFLLLILCGLNIFVFTTIDISLMFVFFAEYMIIFLFHKWKSIAANAVSFVLMPLPFLQFLINLLMYSDREILSNLLDSSFIGNLVLGFAIVPFAFQCTRIMLVAHVIDLNGRLKKGKEFLNGILFSLAATGFFAASYAVSDVSLNTKYNKNRENSLVMMVSESNEREIASISYEEDDAFDIITRTVTISPEGKFQIIRCIFEIEAEGETAIYECNYNYSMTGRKKANVEIPDWSKNPIEVTYTSDKNGKTSVNLDLYVKDLYSVAAHKKYRLEF